ncbi:hypothetical protein KC921_01415 [Candidatus Woesebacteria bacterium]|nr:hypothetical protein [Candidatus Woesebacteria bacterium]
MKKRLIALWWTVDLFFEQYRSLVVLFALVVFLHIPSYFEPYWYGDEAIYLTVGEGINQGKILYKDIVDHKTPVIYYLARVPNQLSFRLLLTAWMIPIAAALLYLARICIPNRRVAWLTAAAITIAISLPTFEGMIPNGELFVLGFFLSGLALLIHTLQSIKLQRIPSLNLTKLQSIQRVATTIGKLLHLKQQLTLLLSGMLFGLAVLTKVPASFDVAAAFLLIALTFIFLRTQSKATGAQLSATLQFVATAFWVALGAALPVLLSIVYFATQGALADYLQFGLLYNLHYTGTWVPETTILLSQLFFSLKTKLLLVILASTAALVLGKKIKPMTLFLTVWVWWALIATSLSNRPYPHYALQLLPPLGLFVGMMLYQFWVVIRTHKNTPQLITKAILFVTTIALVLYGNAALGFWKSRYSATEYYQKIFKVITKQISPTEYYMSFNPLIADNQRVADYINLTHPEEIYIWGTDPMLYAQTHTTPTDKFTVLFHVADLNVYDQTIDHIISGAPEYIVIMKDAEKTPRKLRLYINNNYKPVYNLEYLTLWERQSATL